MFIKVVAWTFSSAFLAGAAVFSQGAVSVRVLEKHPDGTHLRLLVPAAVIPVGLKFAPAESLREASVQIKPWRSTIEAATDGLEKSPDGVLVEVRDQEQHVMVAKHGDSIVVDVDDRDETVHVSVPLGTVHRVLAQLSEAGPGI